MTFLAKSESLFNALKADSTKRKRYGRSSGFNAQMSWNLNGNIPRSLYKILLKLVRANLLIFGHSSGWISSTHRTSMRHASGINQRHRIPHFIQEFSDCKLGLHLTSFKCLTQFSQCFSYEKLSSKENPFKFS